MTTGIHRLVKYLPSGQILIHETRWDGFFAVLDSRQSNYFALPTCQPANFFYISCSQNSIPNHSSLDA